MFKSMIDYLEAIVKRTNRAAPKRLLPNCKLIYEHLTKDIDEVAPNYTIYRLWHPAMTQMIENLNIQRT